MGVYLAETGPVHPHPGAPKNSWPEQCNKNTPLSHGGGLLQDIKNIIVISGPDPQAQKKRPEMAVAGGPGSPNEQPNGRTAN